MPTPFAAPLPFFLPSPPLPEYKKRKRLGFPREYEYSPLMVAIAKGIVKVGKPPKRVFAPAEFRPVIVPKKYKRKMEEVLKPMLKRRVRKRKKKK